MALRFQDFNKATGSKTPQFAAAELAEANAKQRAKEQANALRSQNTLGAAEIYNRGMGDRTPIGDKLWGQPDPMAGYSEADMAAQQTADQVGAESGADVFTGEGVGLEGLDATGLDTLGGEVGGEALTSGATDALATGAGDALAGAGGEALASAGGEALAGAAAEGVAGAAASGAGGNALMSAIPGIGQALAIANILRMIA